jgi:hypothetical protein
MKQILLIAGLLITLTNAFSQDGLDDIFDDGDKNSKFHLGTDFITWATGTVNIYTDITLTDNLKWQVGAGFTPFGLLFDVTDAIAGGEIPILEKNLNLGSYVNTGFKFYPIKKYDVSKDLNSFYYLEMNRWGSKSSIPTIKNVRTKINFGAGINYGLSGRLNLEVQYGITYARLKYLQGSEQYENKRIFGLNLGFGINYAL